MADGARPERGEGFPQDHLQVSEVPRARRLRGWCRWQPAPGTRREAAKAAVAKCCCEIVEQKARILDGKHHKPGRRTNQNEKGRHGHDGKTTFEPVHGSL